MPSKKSLLAELKLLKPVSRGRTFSDTLTPSQRKQYWDALSLVNSLDVSDRPKYATVRELLKKHLGKSPGESTFIRDLRSLNESPKRSK